jgi:hypothetical protein
MEILNNAKFTDKLLENLEKMDKKPKKDFKKIKKLFPNENLYILGGYVRDSILNELYGYNLPINDLDILAFDDNFQKKISCFNKKDMSRFGGLKLKYQNPEFSIDLFSTGNIFFLNQNPHLEKNLENVLRGVDLTTSAFAYNIGKNEIYYHPFGFKDISKMEINILNTESLVPSSISRLIIHADKMKFKLGEGGINYIKEKYKPELDKDIRNFLEYKKTSFLFLLVKGEINSMLKLH